MNTRNLLMLAGVGVVLYGVFRVQQGEQAAPDYTAIMGSKQSAVNSLLNAFDRPSAYAPQPLPLTTPLDGRAPDPVITAAPVTSAGSGQHVTLDVRRVEPAMHLH